MKTDLKEVYSVEFLHVFTLDLGHLTQIDLEFRTPTFKAEAFCSILQTLLQCARSVGATKAILCPCRSVEHSAMQRLMDDYSEILKDLKGNQVN